MSDSLFAQESGISDGIPETCAQLPGSRLASKSQLPLLMFTINIAAVSSISLLDFPTLFFFSFKNLNNANIAGKISQHKTESSELIVKNSCPSSVFLIMLDPRMKLRNGNSPLQSNCKEVQEWQGRTVTLPVQQEAMVSPWAAVDTTQSLPWFYLQDRLPLAPFPPKALCLSSFHSATFTNAYYPLHFTYLTKTKCLETVCITYILKI